jgi:hypothetical protein
MVGGSSTTFDFKESYKILLSEYKKLKPNEFSGITEDSFVTFMEMYYTWHHNYKIGEMILLPRTLHTYNAFLRHWGSAKVINEIEDLSKILKIQGKILDKNDAMDKWNILFE